MNHVIEPNEKKLFIFGLILSLVAKGSNTRERAMINRIAVDVEHLPDYKNIRRMIFFGTNSSPLSRLSTAVDLSAGWGPYGVTLSSFAIPWSPYLVRLYDEVTGGNFAMVGEGESDQFKQMCGSYRWPEPGSVSKKDDVAIICLGMPMVVALIIFQR